MENQQLNESVNLIKEKVFKNDFKLTPDEKLILKEVYFEITKIATRKGKVLDLNCAGCLSGAYTVVSNYAKYYMTSTTIDKTPKAEVEVLTVKNITADRTREELKQLLKDKQVKFAKNISDTKLNELVKEYYPKN